MPVALTTVLALVGCVSVDTSQSSGSARSPNSEAFEPAPPFELPDLAGRNVRLEDFEGKVVLLDLWATWCTPCLEGIPFYNELLGKYEDDGLAIIGVAVQSDFDAIQPIIDRYEIEYPILVGNKDIESDYRLLGFPTAFLIDRNGAIRHKLFGTRQVETAEDEIRELLRPGA